jgi:replicative DNA helicase
MRNENSNSGGGRDSSLSLLYDGKVPPQALDAEDALIGACIVDSSALAEVGSLLSPEVFYRKDNGLIYEAISALTAEGRAVDAYSVSNALRSSGKLEEAGGAGRLAGLSLKVASGAHAADHARILVEKYAQRRLVEFGYRATALGFDDSADVADSIAQAGSLLADVSGVLTGRNAIPHVSVPVGEAKQEAHRRVQLAREHKATGVPTGLVDLDEITGGWQPGNLIILAARPAMGKTALMLHFAKAAAKSGVPAVIFSLEMSAVSLANRLILSETDVAPDRYRRGYLSNGELDKVDLATITASQFSIHVDESDNSMPQIRAKARTLHHQGKCGVVLIDYLQLCRVPVERWRNRNREQEISAMSREAKMMAKELGIPVILLSQLSREVEKRGSKKPALSDLRESGAIEQDADIVMFIYRSSYYHSDGIGDDSGELLIEKNRDGATGKVDFRYSVGMLSIFDTPAAGQDMPQPLPHPLPTGAPASSYYEPTDRDESFGF